MHAVYHLCHYANVLMAQNVAGQFCIAKVEHWIVLSLKKYLSGFLLVCNPLMIFFPPCGLMGCVRKQGFPISALELAAPY